MPPRRTARPAPPDVEALRAALGRGKIVRVGIAPSDQFPVGLTGRVRRIGDPAIDGDEFLFVEVPVGGAKDVLPFAVTDLTARPPRGVTAASAAPADSIPARRAAAPRATAAGPPRVQPVSATPSTVAGPTSFAGPTIASVRDVPLTPAAESPSARPGPSGRATGSTTRGKRAPVTITISTAGDESAAWQIEARIGAKAAVRPTPIPPSRVWDIVLSLGEPKLTGVVQTLLEDHRRATQARADALAAELSVLQAELSSFPDRDR